MKERSFKSLADFQAAAKAKGYKVQKKNNERLGDFYIALKGSSPVGSFCARYARDSFMFI